MVAFFLFVLNINCSAVENISVVLYVTGLWELVVAIWVVGTDPFRLWRMAAATLSQFAVFGLYTADRPRLDPLQNMSSTRVPKNTYIQYMIPLPFHM